MSVVGTWNSFFSWGCGSYSQGTVTFNNDGTFKDSGGGTGTWSQREGTVVLIYPTIPTAYAGNVVHGSITGMGFHHPSRSTSYWYALKQGIGLNDVAKAEGGGTSQSGAELAKSA
jgi:hypothetical protein